MIVVADETHSTPPTMVYSVSTAMFTRLSRCMSRGLPCLQGLLGSDHDIANAAKIASSTTAQTGTGAPTVPSMALHQ